MKGETLNELALFAGAGGGILGGKLLGWNTIGAVEIEEYPRKVLFQRQRDGILEPFPIWDDITTFNGRPWKGCVDIISGGFPCQDISAAGKGAGIEGERSGLWGEMARVIDEVRPRFAFVENSPMLTIRGLGRVLGNLSELGYNARWCVLGADDIGARHRRKRIWILAYTDKQHDDNGRYGTSSVCGERPEQTEIFGSKQMAYTHDQGLQRPNVREAEHRTEKGLSTKCRKITYWDTDPADIPDTRCKYGEQRDTTGMEANPEKRTTCTIHNKPGSEGCDKISDASEQRLQERSRKEGEQTRKTNESERLLYNGEFRPTEPQLGRVAHGVAHRVDRLKAIGNGQVPAVAATAFTILSEGLI